MGARQADLHALGPWLGGAGAFGLIGLGGAGAGGASALLASGSGAGAVVTGGGLSWAGWPLALKGLAVSAVVATTGTAAVELPKAVTDAPAPPAVARVVDRAPAAISGLGAAVREQAEAQASVAGRARRARAAREAAAARVRTGSGGAADLAISQRRPDVAAITPAVAGATAGRAVDDGFRVRRSVPRPLRRARGRPRSTS